MDFQDLVETSIDFFMAQFEASASSGAQVPTFNINDRSNDDEVLNLDLPLLDQNSGSPGAQNIPIEELKARRALEFYSAKTGNPIRPRDRQAFETGHDEFPGVMNMPPHVIRYGIMASILICKSKVNSFSYCLGQIHAAAEAGISPQICAFFEQTFDVRLAGKKIQFVDPDTKALTPEGAEYLARMRAAGSKQPTLPGTGADLVEGEFKK